MRRNRCERCGDDCGGEFRLCGRCNVILQEANHLTEEQENLAALMKIRLEEHLRIQRIFEAHRLEILSRPFPAGMAGPLPR